MGVHLTSYIDPPRGDPQAYPIHKRPGVDASYDNTLHRRLTRRRRNIDASSTKFVTYACKICRNHIASSLHIISRDYRGKTGDAYLISRAFNVSEDRIERRAMLTGQYIVCDILCNMCRRLLGWKYLKSERTEQRYKEGKYILELETVCKSD